MKRAAVFAITLIGIIALASDQAPPPTNPRSIEFAGLHNVFKIDDTLYSGSSPDSDAAFAALSRTGVKVIISVDGSKPHVELARKHGMRYVHLPIGYDGLPKQRIAELIKAADGAHGPIYIHCHHGKHRGPAAVAVVCEGIRGWNPGTATAWLKQAGTSDDYAGLYRDIRDFQKPDAEMLAKTPSQLPEVAPTPSLVDTMVAIDEHFDRLKSAQAVEWREIPGQPDLSPAQTAALLWEHFREVTRDPSTAKRGTDYAAKLASAEKTAKDLMTVLKANAASEKDAAFRAVSRDCTACHKAHRN